MENENNDPSGREQKISFLLDAPGEVVWDVWINPEEIKHWWGPNGFTNTIEKMQVEKGGEWIFIMHGPDGEEFPNRTIFREVIQHKKIIHEHFDTNFIAVMDFESQGNKTHLTWYKLYETKELFGLVEIKYKANEGLMQTVEIENILIKDKVAQKLFHRPVCFMITEKNIFFISVTVITS